MERLKGCQADRRDQVESSMIRPSIVVCFAIILWLCPCSLLAQRTGGRVGRGGAGSPAGGPADSQEMKDFKRGVAVQADELQVSQFQLLAKDTEIARNQARELIQQPGMTRDQATRLASAVEKVRGESQDFLTGLSEPQRSGLKVWRKNVEKADSDVGRNWKALNQDLERAKIDAKQMADETEKLAKALTKFATEQLNLGREMGIQSPPE